VESVYQECLEFELADRGIPFQAKPVLELTYKGRPLKSRFIPDVVCFNKIVVELKAVSALVDEHRAQVHNYLHASGLRLGVLLDFGHYPKLEFERIVL
jgi:GxxExxY protein